MATMFDQWASNFPTWDQLTPAQRVMYGGDPTSYETMRSAHIRYAQPWVQQGLNTTIDPDTLAKLQAARAANPTGQIFGGETDAGVWYTQDPSWTVGEYTIDKNGSISKSLQRETWGQDVEAVYDDQGRLISTSSGDSTALGLAKFGLLSLGAYGGVNAADSALTAMSTAPTTGAATGGMTNGAFLGEGVASGVPAWDAAAINSAVGSGQLGAAGSYLGQTMSGGTGLETIGNALGGSGSALGSGTSALVNGAKDVMGSGGLNWGGVLGAAAGALDSRDQEQKQSRDPWEPAQGFLKQQIGQGQDLSNRYQANPFSADQMAAYNNQFGLLNAINQNAGGLLGGFNANASGANQFVRGQPQRLQGSTFNLGGYTPGLLTGFTRG
ncbi:MAG: hypothetical protein LC111_10815 [Bacteroidia bacterium]|nr:hypothetical protein [Bacteroidia bacterium]